MRRFRSIVFILPCAILLAIVAIEAADFSYAYVRDKNQLIRQMRQRTLVDGGRLARMAEANLQNSKSKIEQELMLYGTELNNIATALVDPEGRVVLAHDSSWKGRPFGEVVPHVGADLYFRTLAGGYQANERFDPQSARLEVLIPFAYPPAEGEFASSKRGAIYLANDLSEAIRLYRRQNFLAHLPLLAVACFFAVVLAVWLHFRLVGPIRKIVDASRLLADDLHVQVPEIGIGEVGLLARVFNRTSHQLAQNREQLLLAAQVFDNANEAILIADPQTQIVAVNQAFLQTTGYAAGEVVGQPAGLLQADNTDSSFYRCLWRQLLKSGNWSGEIHARRKNGEIYPEWLRVRTVKNRQGKISHFVASFSDLSDVRRMQALADRLTRFDILTNALNRENFLKTVEERLAEAQHSHRRTNLIVLDIDRFKQINEAMGLEFGDQLLKSIADRFKAILQPGDALARLGADEFAVVTALLPAGEDSAPAERYTIELAERLSASCHETLYLNGKQFRIDASMGVALFNGDKMQTASELMREADLAVREAKLRGGNKIVFFEENMGEHIRDRYELEQDLRQALARRQLRLFLQSQFSSDGRLVGAEALLRWQHPLRGLLSPGIFIPLAESSDLILKIDNWILSETCQLLTLLENRGLRLTISVNLSPRHFRQSDFVAQVQEHLQFSGAHAQRLILEITENLVIDNFIEVVSKMETLTETGVRFSMDDFGTGYSSLAYLKRLPIHEIKVDKSFIQDVHRDKSDALLVETIVSVAQHLQLQVVAEGVEDEAQAAFLDSLGNVIRQGYFYAKPLPASEWLEQVEALPVQQPVFPTRPLSMTNPLHSQGL